VTKFAIVTPREGLFCHLNDTELVLVETDADAEYDRQGRIAIRCEPAVLEQASKVPLKGGRIRWRFRPKPEATVGQKGAVVATITRPDGSQIVDQVAFEILLAVEQKAKREKGYVPPFKIVPVDPADNPEDWALAWPDLDETCSPEALEGVAYKPVNVGGVIHVFFSTIFRPYKEQMNKLKSQSAAVAELFNTNYAIWIGYHAILQEQGRNSDGDDIDPDRLEHLLEKDRTRVAQMQVKQAVRTAELQNRSLRATAVAE
jgi:hypothetical protein